MVSRISSSASVDAARPAVGRQLDIPDSKVAGLALRVTPRGAKSWTFRYRDQSGRQKRVSFGKYPAVSLSVARDAAYKALAYLAEGGDPASKKKAAQALARIKKFSTVSDLLEKYLADAERGRHKSNGRPKRAGTMALDRYYAERFVKPCFGDTPLHELTRADLQPFLDEVAASGPSNARHTRNVIRQAYNYAIRREITDRNPAQSVEIARSNSRDRVLTDKELRVIWGAAIRPEQHRGLGMSASMGMALCLEMITLQRGDEVCGLHAREVDRVERTWTIPGHRTKNHLTHVVPLSGLALQILAHAFALAGTDQGFAFPSTKSKHGHLTRHSLNRAMQRLIASTGVTDAVSHDFRRTGATHMTSERIGAPRFIVSRVLNQISDTGGAAAVTGIYDRNEYLPEKRRALDRWAVLLADIVMVAPT